jgi:hypothetical protein
MTTGRILTMAQQKTNGDRRKVERIIVARHSHIPTRSSGEHPTITRVVHGGI